MKSEINDELWKRNKTKKEYGLQINLGEQIEEKIGNFRRFSVLYRNHHHINNIGNKEESKNYSDSCSSSSSDDHSDYYNNFLKKLNEDDENEEIERNKRNINTSPRKIRHSIISKKPKIHRSSILKNKKFRTMLRQSLLKHSKENEINKIINNNNVNINNIENNQESNIIKLTPINEEKSFINNNTTKNINKDNKKLKFQNTENNVSIKSSIASNNSRDINQKINSYLIKNSYNHSNLIGKKELLKFDKRYSINIRNSYTPNSNIVNIYPYKTKNFSSIKSKRSPFKVNESFHSIKNSKSQKIKNNNKDIKSHNNSLEESCGINKKNNLFNPTKIDIESLSKNNNNNNFTKEKEKEKVIKDDEMNIEKFQTPSQGSFKINTKKKRCLFCCIPVN